MTILKYIFFLAFPLYAGSAEPTNSYMKSIKINTKSCISQNISDCQKSICIASPSDCKAQCRVNATHKCQQLSGQHIDGYSGY